MRKTPLNPLEPTYKLPSFQPMELEQDNRPIKQILNTKDIEGAYSKKNIWLTRSRNVNPYTEIEGSKPKSIALFKDRINQLDVKDINNKI